MRRPRIIVAIVLVACGGCSEEASKRAGDAGNDPDSDMGNDTDTGTDTDTDTDTDADTETGEDTSGNLEWVRSIPGPGCEPYDESSIIASSDGAVIITSCFSDPVTFGAEEPNETVLTAVGGTDVFTAKFSADGSFMWAKSAGGANTDKSYGIATLSEGAALVTGEFFGTATFGAGESNETTLASAGEADIFFAKYNEDGTLAWAKRAGGEDFDRGWSVSALSDDSFLVTGYYRTSTTLGAGEVNETTFTSAGDDDIFVANFATDGSLTWARSAGGNGFDRGQSISALPDGAAIATGVFTGTAHFGYAETLESSYYYDVFVAKFNADGGVMWAKSAGGDVNDSANGISVLDDGTAVVTGTFIHAATFGAGEPNETVLTSGGETDIFIAKYGTDGNLIWAKSAGSDSNSSADGISALSDGSFLMAGYFTSSLVLDAGEVNETTLTSVDSEDAFVAEYTTDGSLIWAKSAGGSGNDGAEDVAVSSDGAVLVSGTFCGQATFGLGEENETTLTSVDSRDIFIAKLSL